MAAKKSRLSRAERNFFAMVNQAVFANPFSNTRAALDLKIGGEYAGVPTSQRIQAAITEVSRRIAQFEDQGRADITLYNNPDQTILETAFLFDFFHQFLDRFDRFIQQQIEKGDTSLPVPFAKDAFAFLSRRGFTPAKIHRYFEIVFQMRRAYFFIDRSLIGCSPCMRELRRQLWNNVFTHDIDLYNRFLWNRLEDFSTLLLGETGTGKGTAAMAIGRSGFIPYNAKQGCFEESFTRAFVSLNLSQFSENLIESELFGHTKGAFTGAIDDYEGVFDRCHPNGAIFLDEIGEVALPVQIKLLQVLQDRIFSPVGSHAKHRFNGRVIAATNRSIEDLRRSGQMRDDFYYRLCSDMITVPPLRQRIAEDPRELEDLLNLFITRMLGKAVPKMVLKIKAVIYKELGIDYPWPGNVRELEQCVRRILLNQHYSGDVAESATDLVEHLADGLRNGSIDAQQLITGYCASLYAKYRTYEAVARRLRLDRRTVKKYVDEWHQHNRQAVPA